MVDRHNDFAAVEKILSRIEQVQKKNWKVKFAPTRLQVKLRVWSIKHMNVQDD